MAHESTCLRWVHRSGWYRVLGMMVQACEVVQARDLRVPAPLLPSSRGVQMVVSDRGSDRRGPRRNLVAPLAAVAVQLELGDFRDCVRLPSLALLLMTHFQI